MTTTNLDKISELISIKEFEQAKELLIDITATEPNNIEALKLLGLCNVNLGLFKEGQSNFETVVKFKNDDATSWFYLANCYDNLDDITHAKAAYIQVLKLRENYIEAYKSLGVLYLKSEEPLKAFEVAKKAITLVNDDYIFYFMAGTALLSAKDFKNCIVYLEKALEFNTKHAQLYNNLGTAYLTLGQYDKAQDAYLKASDLDPKNSITYYNIGSILQIQNKHAAACEFFQKAYNLEKVENYLVALALSEFKAGLYEEAISHYKALAAQHPEKHNFQYNLACCYEMTKEYNFAVKILEQLVMLNPKSKEMAQKLADLYLKIDQPLNAKEIYEKIISIGIVSEEIYYKYALICVKTDYMDTAESIFKKVIELNPNAAYARKDLAVIYLNKRLFDYAEDEFKKAYDIAPDDIKIVFEYANYFYSTTNYEKAKEFYLKVYEKNPKYPNLNSCLAMTLISLNELDEAIKYFKIALEDSPNNPFLLFNLGRVYYLQKKYEDAKFTTIKSIEQMRTIENENLLGLIYFEMGEWENANSIFLSLLSESERNTILLLNSAKCYKNLSEKENAKKQLEKVLEIFPEMEEAQEMLKELK